MKIAKPNFKVLFDNDKFLWFLSFLFAFDLVPRSCRRH